MYQKIKEMYLDNKLTVEQVRNAVNHKYITPEECEIILKGKVKLIDKIVSFFKGGK